MATLKRLKRGDDNDLERNLRLEKVVASKKLRLGNNAATKRLRLAMETDKERKARLEKMVATAQPIFLVYVGAVLSLISFKLDVLST